MTRLLPLLMLLGAPLAVAASPSSVQAQQPRPQALGSFQDWTAATLGSGAQKVCYAFSRASNRIRVRGRTEVEFEIVIRITERPQDG